MYNRKITWEVFDSIGKDGIDLMPGSTVIDMTTTSPKLSKRI